VNVSVAGGRRVEIKGVHHHRHLPLLAHNEAFRQLNLLRIRADLERRGVGASMLDLPAEGLPWEVSPLVIDAGGVVLHSDYLPARQAVDRGEMACAVRLPGFKGLLRYSTQPGVTFAQEIADRVRVIACPRRPRFMVHSDLEKDGLGRAHWGELARALQAESADALVLVWAPREDAATAAREVLIRANEALVGIPSETRQAFPDGTTGFERILPGPDRMYPDTDTPPLPIPDSTLAEVRAQLGESPWARQKRYEGMGLDTRMARALATAPWADLFDELRPQAGEPARRLAGVLEKRLPFYLRRARGAKPRLPAELPGAVRFAPLVRALEEGEIRPEALIWAVDGVLDDTERPVEGILDRLRPLSSDDEGLKVAVGEVAARSLELRGRPRDVLLRWGMGQVMRRFLGRVSPLDVKKALEDALGEEAEA
jgi:glutamyl-tRNA(Gln) amidotransferase subunit E